MQLCLRVILLHFQNFGAVLEITNNDAFFFFLELLISVILVFYMSINSINGKVVKHFFFGG